MFIRLCFVKKKIKKIQYSFARTIALLIFHFLLIIQRWSTRDDQIISITKRVVGVSMFLWKPSTSNFPTGRRCLGSSVSLLDQNKINPCKSEHNIEPDTRKSPVRRNPDRRVLSFRGVGDASLAHPCTDDNRRFLLLLYYEHDVV